MNCRCLNLNCVKCFEVVSSPKIKIPAFELVFWTRFWARPGPVFCPPNARFWVSWWVEYITVILRLSCIEIAQVIFQNNFKIFHQQGQTIWVNRYESDEHICAPNPVPLLPMTFHNSESNNNHFGWFKISLWFSCWLLRGKLGYLRTITSPE